MNKGNAESHAETRSSRRESNPPTSALSAAPRAKKPETGSGNDFRFWVRQFYLPRTRSRAPHPVCSPPMPRYCLRETMPWMSCLKIKTCRLEFQLIPGRRKARTPYPPQSDRHPSDETAHHRQPPAGIAGQHQGAAMNARGESGPMMWGGRPTEARAKAAPCGKRPRS